MTERRFEEVARAIEEEARSKALPARLLDKDGHEISKGIMQLQNPPVAGAFWPEMTDNLDELRENGKALSWREGESVLILSLEIHHSNPPHLDFYLGK